MNKYSITPALGFNDILLVPQYSDIESRLNVDLTTNLTKNIKIKNPISSTNMSTITEEKMGICMAENDCGAFLHRFGGLDHVCGMIKKIGQNTKNNDAGVIPSIGAKDEDKLWVDTLLGKSDYSQYIKAILVDIAHGDSKSVVDIIRYIKDNYPKFDVIGGNIAAKSGFIRLVDAGADAVRVGISGGSACTTKYVTGHGLPTLASIIDCAEVAKETKVSLIADGGMSLSGDIVKALSFGADSVCLGGMLAGTSETPGALIHLENGDFKEYYGMSSKKAQEIYKGGLRRGIASEGIDKLVPYKGQTTDVLNEILGGVRSGLTYAGARTIEELQENAQYMVLQKSL